jgi:hypothetical protein
MYSKNPIYVLPLMLDKASKMSSSLFFLHKTENIVSLLDGTNSDWTPNVSDIKQMIIICLVLATKLKNAEIREHFFMSG